MYHSSDKYPESLDNIFVPATTGSKFNSLVGSARLTPGQWYGANLHSSAWLGEAHEWRRMGCNGVARGVPDDAWKTGETDEYGSRTCYRGHMRKGVCGSKGVSQ